MKVESDVRHNSTLLYCFLFLAVIIHITKHKPENSFTLKQVGA